MQKFVICGTQRTGTSLLDSTLNSHSGICCYSEVFIYTKGRGGRIEGSYRRFINQKPLLRKFGNIVNRASLVEQYLDELFEVEGVQASGFKLMLSQVKIFPSITSYMRTHAVSAIHIIRNNALKTLISRLSARERKLYHTTENLKIGKVHIPVVNLRRNLVLIESEKEEWKRRLAGIQTLEVHYEDILRNEALVMTDIQRFIGVDCVDDLKSRLLKINPDNLANLIGNYDEVRHCLEGTSFERYL